MRRRSRVLIVLLGLCAVLVTGCGSTDIIPSQPAEVAVNPTTAAANTDTCRPPSMAHCYTEATMQSYINVVIPMITKFFQAEYTNMPAPRQYIFVADGEQANSACTGGAQDDTAYFYCPADQNVYLGQQMMWTLYSQDGDAAPAIGLAHEWGHNIQTQVGVPAPTTDAEEVNHEDQADCVAGAWIQYAIQQGWFEQEDVDTTGRLLVTISDAESPNRTHGDLQERSGSMAKGIQGGLQACNAFYPDTPIISSP